MNAEVFLYEVAKLSPSAQEALVGLLEGTLSPDEIRALKVGIAYIRLLVDDQLRNAMKSAMAEQLYNEFNGGKK